MSARPQAAAAAATAGCDAGVIPAPRSRAWRDRGLAGLAGAVLGFAQAPYDLLPLLVVAFTALVWLIDRTLRVRSGPRAILAAAALGWCFGFGYFLAGLWWIGAAFLVEAERFAWLLPFAIAGLPAGLALFFAFAAGVAAAAWSLGARRLIALAVAFAFAEGLRGWLLTGFPWNEIGYALTGSLELMQAASLLGVSGLTALAVFAGAAPATFVDAFGRLRWGQGAASLGVAAALLAATWIYGDQRLEQSADHGNVPGVTLRIVQPGIGQRDKWDPALREQNFQHLLELSRSGEAPLDANTLLIWPESAFAFFYQSSPLARAEIADLLPPGATLISGALRYEGGPGDDLFSVPVYNSLLVIDDEGDVAEIYDKVDLVPFGEFLPLQEWLENLGLEQLTRLKGGFAAGETRRLIQAGSAPPFVPTICYEIIFARSARVPAARGNWILNLTNDAWFGDTPGPRQHLRQSQVRAVATGLPVVRVANTGISAIIDPYGRNHNMAKLNVSRAFNSGLPDAINPPPAAGLPRELLQLLFIVIWLALFWVGWRCKPNRLAPNGGKP